MARYCIKGQELLAIVATAVMESKAQPEESESFLSAADALLSFNEHLKSCVDCADDGYHFAETIPHSIQ
jgi:hypothetical protein